MAARAAGGGLRTLLRRVRGPGGGAAEPEGARGLGDGPPPPGRVENQLYGAGRGPQAPRAPDGGDAGGGGGGGGASRVSVAGVRAARREGRRVSMVTAYDFPSASHVCCAGVDIILVGDSAGMVVHGYDTTLPVSVDDMLTHCRAVARGARRPLLLGDLPFGSYEEGPAQALRTAVRFLKEGGVDAVKIEGGGPRRAAIAQSLVEDGVAVMGHTGLTPQAVSAAGGFRAQGRSAADAERVFDDALRLQDAGCFGVVLECLPPQVAGAITAQMEVPTVGIGAGPHTTGQVLVYHDLLGMVTHPHYKTTTPRFVKQYAQCGDQIVQALRNYREDVEAARFPAHEHTPYTLPAAESRRLAEALQRRGLDRAAEAVASGGPA